MSRVFISYAHHDHDRGVARRLYRDIASAGHAPWLDEIDLIPGEVWRDRIILEIKGCTYFLALISHYSLNKRGFVQRELRLALDVIEDLPIDERFFIPVRLDDCRPKDERLARLHWVDLFPRYESGLPKLLMALADRPGRLYAEVGLEIPDNISSWDDNKLFEYIETVLRPEASFRAERDYSRIDLDDDARPKTLSQRVDEKIEEVARSHTFTEAWHRYLRRRAT